MDETYKLSAKELNRKISKGDMSALEVTKAFLLRAQDLNSKINAFVTFNEKAEEQARAVDKKREKGEKLGPLAGIPVGVKDMLCTKSLKTTACSRILENYIPPYSATVVECLENADAIVLGKLNCDEFAMGSSTENTIFGPTRNPWNTDYVAGGSSGGSAAAVASRMVPVAIGTDTGGSIRQPASFCGVVGLKPTYGRVSRYGIVAFASSLDQAGPLSHTIEDSALVLESISGFDDRDSTSSRESKESWAANIDGSVSGLKIGVSQDFLKGVDADVTQSLQKQIENLKNAGAEIVDINLSLKEESVATYYLIATSEASSNLARYDGIRFGNRVSGEKDLETLYLQTRGRGFGAEVKRRIILGTYALSSGYYDAYYKKACQMRRLIKSEFEKAFSECDVILGPVTTSTSFKIGERINDPLKMYLNDIFTISANLSGIPGMSVPGGLCRNGLPIGVQLLASHFNEKVLFQVGAFLEKKVKCLEVMPHGVS